MRTRRANCRYSPAFVVALFIYHSAATLSLSECCVKSRGERLLSFNFSLAPSSSLCAPVSLRSRRNQLQPISGNQPRKSCVAGSRLRAAPRVVNGVLSSLPAYIYVPMPLSEREREHKLGRRAREVYYALLR